MDKVGRAKSINISDELQTLKKEIYALDAQRFWKEICRDFARSIDPELTRRLVTDDTWLDSLLLEADLVEEFDGLEIKDVVTRMVVLSLDREDSTIIATGIAGGYELRAIIMNGRTGIALVSDNHIIAGERVLKNMSSLRATGEIYAYH
ncbi:MAG: hypothetical protein F7C34_02500 [Desulfurococcales archaeon]|nr:hypothetical protein [Desulfurococcales archaeon]